RENDSFASRLYAHRTAGGHCHHRAAGRTVAPGRAAGPRSGPATAVQEQYEADWAGAAQLSRNARHVPGDGVRGISKSGFSVLLHARLPLVGFLSSVPGSGSAVRSTRTELSRRI